MLKTSAMLFLDRSTRDFIPLALSTRVDYGGRASLLCSSLPLWVLSAFLTVIYTAHSSHYSSLLWILWLTVGLLWMVSEWVRVGLFESYFHYTISARANGLASFSLLVCFEPIFFAGVFWIYSLNNVHPHPELSFFTSGGNDLSVFGSFESSALSFYSESFMDSVALFYFYSPYSQSLIGENLLGIYLNLWILLAVSLLLQITHRFASIFY